MNWPFAMATAWRRHPDHGRSIAKPHWHNTCSVSGAMDVAVFESRRKRRRSTSTEALTDAELLSALFNDARLPAARRLLKEHAGLRGLLRLGEHGLRRSSLLSGAEARRVCAALELGRRATLAGLDVVPEVIESFECVVAWARPRLADLDHEEVWLLTLDGRNGLRAARRVARGGLHGCALAPKDVLSPALRDAATGIILVHNHPSGASEPSPEDVAMTETLAAACEVVGITLLDHVVVAKSGASSILGGPRAA